MPGTAILLRGVNVGGHGTLPMVDLRRLLEQDGATEVATYIQSGNIVLDHPKAQGAALAERVADLIQGTFGFRPTALAIGLDALEALLQALPRPTGLEPKNIHVFLCATPPPPDLPDQMARYCTQNETLRLLPGAVAVLAPNGIGRSKLPAPLERALGRQTTARNLNTLLKLHTMLQASA